MSRIKKRGDAGWLMLTEQQLKDGAHEHLEINGTTIYLRWSGGIQRFMMTSFGPWPSYRGANYKHLANAQDACREAERLAATRLALNVLLGTTT